MKLIEENSLLHRELKEITVHDILAEFRNSEKKQQQNTQSSANKSKELAANLDLIDSHYYY